MVVGWLSEKLIQKVKQVFEPRYGRTLTNEEVEDIANNLTLFIEELTKFRWKNNYGKQISY